MNACGGTEARGLTLLEALLAAAVLAAVVAAVIMPFAAGARCTAQDARSTLAVHLAEALMEEILAKPFSDPDGADVEMDRAAFDDMDDYDQYTEAEGAIADMDGVVEDSPASVGLSREATVEAVYVAGQDVGEPATFRRITVQVRYRGEPIATLARLAYANE